MEGKELLITYSLGESNSHLNRIGLITKKEKGKR